ncbi:hypothetical protein EG329_004483 [Mollisiaceae sp. DMI_Dod_QoI]|nr:hypothetical protein EG329_004483 [Helotiales sp. DMI_Dod_QoI]
MGFFDSLGAWADRMSTSERNHKFYLIRTPLFKQFLDICVWNYPDPLDLYAWSYEIVPMYFFAGAINYGIMIFLISLYSQFTFGWTIQGNLTTPPSLFTDLQSPRSKSFQTLFLISFVLRAWNLGLALFWSWFLESAFGILKLDRERPWLAQLFWLMLSRDWDIAQYYSGFFASKSSEVLQQESAARLNETWGGFLIRCVKITLITTPLEMFVKNLPYMVVGLVFAVGRNGAAISAFLGRAVEKLRSFSLVEHFLKLDEAISAKRELVMLLLIQHFRKGQFHWRRSKLPKYNTYLHMFVDANIKPVLSAFQRYVESCFRRFWKFPKLVFQLSRVDRSFKISQRKQSSEALPGRRFRLLRLYPSTYPNEPIICVLSWHNLDSKPSYTAISYVWGSDERNSTIILNGKQYQTTTSAVTALKGLRSRWRKKNFWIDAICIDQTSDTDKAEQICMRWCYKARCGVWKGNVV